MRSKKIDYRTVPVEYEKFPVLVRNWEYSAHILRKLNDSLSHEFSTKGFTVAIAGSFGRMDAAEGLSDFDYLLLMDRNIKNPETIQKRITKIAKAHGLPMPNTTGVFTEPTSIDSMIHQAGSNDDNLYRSAKRLLLLMECKPIYNETLFSSAIDTILKHYLQHSIADLRKEPIYLLNDVIRYFRGICVNYEYNFWKKADKWVIRYIKLLHSRLIMYAGLLFLTLNSSKVSHASEKYEYIRSQIFLTPLEKLLHVYTDNDDHSFNHLLGIYSVFLSKLSDPMSRELLKFEYEDRHHDALYSELRVTGDALRKELMRFLLSRKGVWSDNVIEYLIF